MPYSEREIIFNRGIVKFLQEMKKINAIPTFYKINKRYGIAVILLKPALEKMVSDYNKRWNIAKTILNNDVEHKTVIFLLVFSNDYELTEDMENSIKMYFLRKGIASETTQLSSREIAIALNMETYIKHINRELSRKLVNVKTKAEYVPEEIILMIHFWTGSKPSFLQLSDLVK